MPEWLIVAIKEYLSVKETSFSVFMGTVRSLFDLLWVQLNFFSFLTSWPPWLENRQSWIIKIGARVYNTGLSGAFTKKITLWAKPFILWY